MKKILVPVDFSKHSYQALEVGAQIAKKTNAKLYITHILSMPHYALTDGDTPASVYLIKLTRQKMKETLQKPFLEGVDVEEEIIYDEAITIVSEKANSLGVDLIIMGTHGASGTEEMVIGSNTEKIVRMSEMPVLALKHRMENFDVKDIAYASNFYTENDSAFEKVKLFADIYNAKIHLVKVVTPNVFERTPYSQKLMDDFAVRFSLTNFQTHIFNDDHIDDGIIEFSRLNNMDLIAMNTHGRTGLARILNGSIAEGITNHSPLPVMSIRIADSKKSDNILFPKV